MQSQTAFQPPPLLVPEIVLRQAVSLPQGEDINEWLASNLTDFYNQVNLLYGSLTQFCTPETCPTMSAGPKFDYLWADSSLFKKPIRLSAPEYIDTLLTSIQTALDDESTIVAAFKPASGAREVSLTLTGPCIFIKASIQCTPFMQGLFDQPRFSLDQNLALTQNPSRLAVGGNLDVVDVLTLLPFTMNPAAFITAVFAEIGMIVTVLYMSACVYQRYQAPVPYFPSRLHAHFATAIAMSLSLLFISLSLAASVVTSASLNSLITSSLTQYGISTSFSIIGPGILALVVGLSVPATWVSWRGLAIVMKEDMKELSGEERKKLTFDSFYTLVFGAPKDSVGKSVSRESRYTGVRGHSDGAVAVTVEVNSSQLAIEDDVVSIPAAAVLIPPRNESASVLEVDEDVHSGSPRPRPVSFIPGIAPYTINQESLSKRPHTIGHSSEIAGPKSPFIPSYDPRSVPLSPPPRTDSAFNYNNNNDTTAEIEPPSPPIPPTFMLPPSFPTQPNLSAAAQILNHRATTQLAKTRHPLSIGAQPFSGAKLPTSPLRRALIIDEPETPPDSPPLHGTHATAQVSPSPPGSDLSMDPTIVDGVVTAAAVAAAGGWEFEEEEEQEMDDRSYLSGEDELQVVSPGFVIRDAGSVLEGKVRVDENTKVAGYDSVVEKKKNEGQQQRLSFILDGVQNGLANDSKRTRRKSAYLEAVEQVKRQSAIFEGSEGEDTSRNPRICIQQLKNIKLHTARPPATAGSQEGSCILVSDAEKESDVQTAAMKAFPSLGSIVPNSIAKAQERAAKREKALQSLDGSSVSNLESVRISYTGGENGTDSAVRSSSSATGSISGGDVRSSVISEELPESTTAKSKPSSLSDDSLQMASITPIYDSAHSMDQLLQDLMDGKIERDRIMGILGTPDPIHRAILQQFIRRMPLEGDLVRSLRLMAQAIPLKGEAQQIDRVLSVFSEEWWTVHQCVGFSFRSQDIVYGIVFSLVLLNTDLHSANVKNKMTPKAFIKNTMSYVSTMLRDDDSIDEMDANSEELWLKDLETELKDMYTSVKDHPILQNQTPKQSTLDFRANSRSLTLPGNGNKQGSAAHTISPTQTRNPALALNFSALRPRKSFQFESPFRPATTNTSVHQSPKTPSNEFFSSLFSTNTLPSSSNNSSFHTPLASPTRLSSPDRSQHSRSSGSDPSAAGKVTLEGLLVRKMALTTNGKRAESRQWVPVWCVLHVSDVRGVELCMFDVEGLSMDEDVWANGLDAKSIRIPTRPPQVLSALHSHSKALPSPGYNQQRQHAFYLCLPSGAVFIFQTENSTVLREWTDTLNYWAARRSAGPLRGGTHGSAEFGWREFEWEKWQELGIVTSPTLASMQLSDGASGSGGGSIGSNGDSPNGGASGGVFGLLSKVEDWEPPASGPLAVSGLPEKLQLEMLKKQLAQISSDLQNHMGYKARMEKKYAFHPVSKNRALSNWAKKWNYLEEERDRYELYVKILDTAESLRG
ncbi:hypothetical protein HDU81_003557 [Chytriomyces hyalinus]|nr:hypothetical protein HDU81_003557 [Chytriomyces hyalinus]